MLGQHSSLRNLAHVFGLDTHCVAIVQGDNIGHGEKGPLACSIMLSLRLICVTLQVPSALTLRSGPGHCFSLRGCGHRPQSCTWEWLHVVTVRSFSNIPSCR